MERVRVAIAGAGFIGKVHQETLRRIPYVEIAALCDSREESIKAAKIYGNTARFTDYRKMIDEIKPDVVHICVPNHLHFEFAKYAIENGVNVFCEKPFTVSVEEAEELVSIAGKRGVKTALNFHNRFWPMTMQMREMIFDGELGEIITVHGEYLQDWMQYETDYSWRLHSTFSGKTRAVSDIGSHWLDLAEFVTGLKIRKVCAKFKTVYPVRKMQNDGGGTFQKSGGGRGREFKVDTEDCAVILLEFENGAIGTLSISQLFAGAKNRMILSVAGKRRSVRWNSESSNDILIGQRDDPNLKLTKDPSLLYQRASALSSYPGGHVEGFADAVKHSFLNFYKEYMEGKAPEGIVADFQDGLHNMKVCEAVWSSAQSGVWVEVR